MKKTIFILFVFLASSAFSQKLDYEVQDLDHNWINLEDHKGEKLTILDFWATWCKPCIKALPKINELHDEFKDQGIQIIGVNVDGPRNISKVAPFTSSLSIDYLIIHDPDQIIQSDLNVSVMPTLIILDSNQKEVYRHQGYHAGDEEIIRKKIQSLL